MIKSDKGKVSIDGDFAEILVELQMLVSEITMSVLKVAPEEDHPKVRKHILDSVKAGINEGTKRQKFKLTTEDLTIDVLKTLMKDKSFLECVIEAAKENLDEIQKETEEND